MNKIIVIIPTYNESENIAKMISLIHNLDIDLEILIVDDNSPDGTSQIIEDLKHKDSKLHLITQKNKMGLGTAYKKGFEWALDNSFDKIIQIDADLSHDPTSIPELLKASNEYDIVVGSRYVKGVNVINWPISRLLLSYFANKYVRLLTRMPINDATSGYKCIKSDVVRKINMNKVISQGYSFQIEVNFLAWNNRFKVGEVPIIFYDRTIGQSKMSKKIIWEAIFIVPKLALKRLFRL